MGSTGIGSMVPWMSVYLATMAAGCETSPSAAHADTDAGASTLQALPVAPIGHKGRWLTDAAGRVLLVHGVNMVCISCWICTRTAGGPPSGPTDSLRG